MTGWSSPWKGWWATLLVVATISGVSSYSPPTRADSGCALNAARAQQIEDGLTATRDGRNLAEGGRAIEVLGALITVVGFLVAPPVSVLGAALMVGGATATGIGVEHTPSATQPQGACENAFAALPDAQRKQVIALLHKGDTLEAMALLDPPSVALPPDWIHLGLSPSGFGGSRAASTGVVAAGQSPTAGQSSGGGQTR